MDQNMKQLQNSMDQKMEQLQNSIVTMILHTLYERFPRGDIGAQGNHENGENKIVEPQSHMENILTNVKNIKIESQNHDYSSL
jgi:hypothetical protein